MASLYEIAQQERRNAQTGGYSGYPAGRVGQQTSPGTRISRGNAAGLYKPKAAKPYLVSKDKSLIDASQAVTGMALPDGSVQPIQASSGAPFVVQKPGSRNTYLDPETGNELQPDITSPTGLRDVTVQRQEEQAARASERSRVATAKLYEKVQGQMAKEQEEAQKQRNAEKANTFLAQGRKYFVDRVSGEPIPHETDQEFKALQTEKAKKKAEETRSRTLRQELERLDIEADETKLTSPLLSDSEHQKLKDAVEEAKLGWHQAGIDPESGGLDALRQDPNNLPAVQKYEQDVAALKAQQETRERLAKIERKKLDLRKQALEPVVWQQEKRTIMEAGSDADLDREIEEGKTTLEELEAKAQEEAAPIKARDDELLASYNDAQARYNGASTVQDRVKARQDLDAARNRLIAWETESAGARESVTESYKALNDRATIYNDTVKARQARAQVEKEKRLQEIRKTPFLAPYADRLEALDADQYTRQEVLNEQYPDGVPEEAQQALLQDIQTKRSEVEQELNYAYQAKEANLLSLYERFGSKTRSENWLNEKDPQLSGLLFNVEQEAKKMGITKQEALESLERNAALDWSNPRRLLSNGKPDFSEDYRMLPEGAVTVNPRHYLDEAEYAKAVEKSPASPEAKKTALAMRRDLAAPLAAQALGELMADPQMGTWMQDNTQGNPLERMEQFNAALKKGGAVEAIWNGFRSGAGSLAGSLLGAGAALTGNELLTDSGKYFQQHAAAYQMASDAAGKGTGALGRFVAKVAQAAPSVAPGIAVGLATAGAGAPVAIGLAANALTAGLQGLGGTYLDAYEAYQDKGFSPTEARAKALTPAIASGLTTSLITLAGGARGAESVLNTVGRDTLRSGVRSAIGRVLGNASEEAIEELTDQVTQGVIAQASYAGEKDIEQILRDGIEAGLIGATLGGAMSGAREVRIGGKAPAAPTSELQPEPVAPVPDVPLPEQQAGIRAAIEAFVPTPELLPPAVAAVAETKGADVAAQDAATALTQIAQGTPLESLPAAQLEAIGLERTDKGVVPRKGVQPLVYQQDGQVVIRDEAADWLDSENQPLIRDQIALSEQDRLVQIQESKQKTDERTQRTEPTGGREESGILAPGLLSSESGEATPTSGPLAPTEGSRGEDEFSTERGEAEFSAEVFQRSVQDTGREAEAETPKKPKIGPKVSPETQAGSVEPTPERQQPLIPSRPKPTPAPKAAPPSRRKAIGKGSAGAASYAEFAADADVDAFTYLSDVRASRSAGKGSSKAKRDTAYRASREKLARLSEQYGVEPAQMADLLTQYNKAVVQQAKGTESGKAFQAESFADFMARSQPEPSPAAPVEPGTTESPESAPTSQNPLQDAADALGYTANGKMKRDGWAASQTALDAKKLQSSAKEILTALSALSKVPGVKLRVTNNYDVTEAQYMPDGTIVINPRQMAENIVRKSLDENKTPREIATHELIHHVAASHISPLQYAALWRSLTPETQEMSLREYFALREGEDLPKVKDSIAGAEFFAQIIEARLKGRLSNQLTESPGVARQLIEMVRQYVEALRNLVGITKDPEWRDIIQKQADAVEDDLRTLLRESGVEADLLGEQDGLRSPRSPEIPSPIPPDSPKANSPSDLQAQQDMEAALDALAQEELRTDPQAMRALAEAQIQDGTVQRGERALGSTEAGARAIQKASIMARELNGKEVRDFEQVREEAKAAIQKDRQAVEDRLFSQIDEGQNFNDLDTAAAVEITNLLTRETAVNPGDDALYARLVKLTNHWADSGSETARALAIRRDPLQRPIDNLRKAISVVKAPPASVRRKVRVAWTDRQKTTAIQKLEKRIRDIENEATVKLMETEADKQAEIKRVKADLNQQIKTLEARPSKDEILRDFIQSDKARQAEILKQMGFTQEDIMLDPEDRYGMREAVLDVPAIREKMGEFSKPAQNAVRLAMLGYSDADIATRTGLKTGDVPAIIERFRQSILKPAIAAEVKAGNTFGNLLTKGLEKLKGVLRMPRITRETLPASSDTDKAYMEAVNHGDMEAAQKMVDQAAKAAGYNVGPVWHETRGEFNEFKISPRGAIFFAFSPEGAKAGARAGAADGFGRGVGRTIRAFIKADAIEGITLTAREKETFNKLPKTILEMEDLRVLKNKYPQDADWIRGAYDSNGNRLSNPPESDLMRVVKTGRGLIWGKSIPDFTSFSDEVARHERLRREGYDAGLMHDESGISLAILNPSKIKSADPVTYDSKGNVIPLSQRFNEESSSILYAPAFSGTLSQAQQAGKITPQDAAKIEAEVDRIVNFALQPARHRNRASGMQAKTVTLQNGQRVKMFVPFDPDDARGYYRYARELSTRDASRFDKLYEYWINGILSGPQTQVANIAGNVGQIAWNYTAQRATESLLNLAYRDKSLATFGEAPHVLRAFMQSFVPAWNQAALAWQTEADLTRSQYLNEPLTVAFKDSELDKQGGQRAAIGGKTGRVVRIPGRLLRFFDSAFKTAILHMEATAHAYREARQKGLRGPALTTYMETRLAEKGNDVWQQAMNVADELLFQSDNWATETAANFVKGKGMKERIQKRIEVAQAAGKPEEVASLQKSLAVANFVSGFMRFLFPFTKTPTNILRVGIRKAGGSALSGLWNVSNGLYQRAANGTPFLDSYSKAKQVQDLSETFLAGLAWTMLAGLAEGDDDDSKKPILIVGNRPFGAAKVGEKEEVMRRYGGTQVVIFRNPVTGQEIGRFQYGRYEPFATALGVIVDTMREVKQSRNKPNDAKKALELTGSVGAHLIAQAESKSFLQGLASIARSVEEIRSGRFEPGQAAAKFIISGIVPNLIRQTLRNQDDLQRDFKTGGWKHEAWPSGQFAEPMIGPGGEEVRKSGTGATRTLVSVPNAPSKPTPENFFQTYNDRHPENRIDRGPLSKDAFYAYGPDGKKKVELSESADRTAFRKLYEETYAKLAGRFVVQNPLIRTANPPLRVVDDARDVNSKALRETRMRFLAQKSRREAAERVKNKPIQK